jgi:hypothetical protein
MEHGIPIPAPYDDPANWPFRWCEYEDASGWVSRIRAEGSHEGKVIAQEAGVSWPTLKRAVRWYLISTGQYDPDSWLTYQRKRKAEARRWFLDKMSERDQEAKRVGAEIRQARETLSEERSAREDISAHVANSYADDSERKERRRELQRKLNAKSRAQWF